MKDMNFEDVKVDDRVDGYIDVEKLYGITHSKFTCIRILSMLKKQENIDWFVSKARTNTGYEDEVNILRATFFGPLETLLNNGFNEDYIISNFDTDEIKNLALLCRASSNKVECKRFIVAFKDFKYSNLDKIVTMFKSRLIDVLPFASLDNQEILARMTNEDLYTLLELGIRDISFLSDCLDVIREYNIRKMLKNSKKESAILLNDNLDKVCKYYRDMETGSNNYADLLRGLEVINLGNKSLNATSLGMIMYIGRVADSIVGRNMRLELDRTHSINTQTTNMLTVSGSNFNGDTNSVVRLVDLENEIIRHKMLPLITGTNDVVCICYSGMANAFDCFRLRARQITNEYRAVNITPKYKYQSMLDEWCELFDPIKVCSTLAEALAYGDDWEELLYAKNLSMCEYVLSYEDHTKPTAYVMYNSLRKGYIPFGQIKGDFLQLTGTVMLVKGNLVDLNDFYKAPVDFVKRMRALGDLSDASVVKYQDKFIIEIK